METSGDHSNELKLPYHDDIPCDICGFMGSYEVMGGHICDVCFKGKRNCDTCKYYKKRRKSRGKCDYHYIEARNSDRKDVFRHLTMRKTDVCPIWVSRSEQ